MALSGDYLIHRTKELDTLKKILKSKKFLYKYCKEEIQFGSVATESILHQFRVAIPMISFSDINIDYLSEHIDNGYGHFGICMKTSWAKEKGFTPVLYIDNCSDLGHRFYDLYNKQLIKTQTEDEKEILQGILDLVGYIKNYTKVIPSIKKKVSLGYNYYDEREWRLVCKQGLNKVLTEERYENDPAKWNSTAKKCFEKFDYSDITHIFVENEEQKKDLINYCKSNSISINYGEIIFTLDEKGIDYPNDVIK